MIEGRQFNIFDKKIKKKIIKEFKEKYFFH